MTSYFSFLYNPFYFNIGSLFLYSIVILKNQRINNGKKNFIFLASIQWILLSGLRHITIGGRDVYISYNYHFYNALNTTWNESYGRFIKGIFLGEDIKDPGYLFFEKLVGLFTDNYQVFLFVVAAAFMIPLGIFVYRNSRNSFVSYLIYSTLFYSFFSLTGFRQTIATALVVLIGYEFIKKRNFILFFILIMMAFTIHKSSIAFLPFYFIANKKITRNYLISILIAFPIIFLLRFDLMKILVHFIGYDDYLFQYEGAGTWTFTVLLLVVLGVTIWKHKIILVNNPQSAHFINALILSVILVPLTFINPSTMRAVQYFLIFLMLLIPEIILSFNRKERVLVYYIALSTLLLLFFRSNPQYLFFWQGG